MSDKPEKPKRVQHLFVVDRTERLTPHMVRVHLGGPAFDAFIDGAAPEKLAATDKYVKLNFAPDPDARPIRRTYTVRSIDTAARTIAIDFVVHGDVGLAGPWAEYAAPGDTLTLAGPGGGYAPSDDPATGHVLLGDDAALPAIAAGLEALPAAATGVALIEVAGPADEQPLAVPAGVDLRWLHRDATGAEPGTLLTEAVRGLSRPSRASIGVFAHGERAAMKAIRRILQDDWGLEKHDMSLSAYWALGREEDAFQAEKREPIGVV